MERRRGGGRRGGGGRREEGGGRRRREGGGGGHISLNDEVLDWTSQANMVASSVPYRGGWRP